MAERRLQTREGLVRGIGLLGLTAAVVNSTIGAGIFVLPAAVALRLGAAAPLAFFVCLATMSVIVACFAIAGSRVSASGGTYAYVERAFGGYASYIAGVLLWLSAVLADGSIARALAGSLSVVVPGLGSPFARGALVVGVFGVLAFVNVRGVTPGVALVQAATAAKLLPLVVLVAAGVFFVSPARLAWPGLPPPAALGESVLLLVFAFVGVEIALQPSGEVEDPARTVPRAVFTALGFTTLLYLALQAVAQGVLGGDLARHPDAPLAEAGARVLGTAGRVLLVAGASVSMGGYLTGSMLGSPRTVFALGRSGVLPGVFARVHPRFRTPSVAIVTHAAIAAGIAATGSFEELVAMSSVAVLVLYLICMLACLRLISADVRDEGPPFHVPGERVLPLLGFAAALWILWHATREELAVTAVVVAVATALYLLWRARGGRSAGDRLPAGDPEAPLRANVARR